ncbi:MAG: hypothetical protein WCV93_05855 [Candidatus Shapirobacteria bacterium]|jgi:hypothetical protein
MSAEQNLSEARSALSKALFGKQAISAIEARLKSEQVLLRQSVQETEPLASGQVTLTPDGLLDVSALADKVISRVAETEQVKCVAGYIEALQSELCDMDSSQRVWREVAQPAIPDYLAGIEGLIPTLELGFKAGAVSEDLLTSTRQHREDVIAIRDSSPSELAIEKTEGVKPVISEQTGTKGKRKPPVTYLDEERGLRILGCPGAILAILEAHPNSTARQILELSRGFSIKALDGKPYQMNDRIISATLSANPHFFCFTKVPGQRASTWNVTEGIKKNRPSFR